MQYTKRLAEFVLDTQYENMPREARIRIISMAREDRRN